jgi:hypothetical protein
MKRAAVLIAIVLSVVATGCASASASTHATDTALTQPIFSEQTVVLNCLYKQQTSPRSFILTCADGNDVLAHLHWVSWGPTAAFATGIEQINDCTPYCAAPAAKFINYPVLVNLWRPEPLPHHPGTLYFSRVTRVYTNNRPPQYDCTGLNTPTCYPQTATFDLWS